MQAGDVAEAKSDASGAHVRKRARLKKKGSMKRERPMSTRTRASRPIKHLPNQPIRLAESMVSVALAGWGRIFNAPVVRGRGMEPPRPTLATGCAINSGGRVAYLAMITETFVLQQVRSR